MTGLASRGQLRMSLFRHALVTVPLVLLLGTLSGSLAGAGSGNPWFDSLDKPAFMPPGWAFGAAWTILYLLLGLALAMLLHARGARKRGRVLSLFVLQLLANFAWAPVFFAWHQIQLALTLIAAMVVLTLALIASAWPIRRAVSLILLPYLAWILFAAALTWRIAVLNPDAERLAPAAASTDIAL